ncbi:MAG: hypothetical protein KAS64_06080 [Spirochaetes bacterium]|nr:hypothetical protein [Spirochaetota bacterium]
MTKLSLNIKAGEKKYSTSIFIILIIFAFIFINSKHTSAEVIQKYKTGYINWSSGKIYSSGSAKFIPNTPDSPKIQRLAVFKAKKNARENLYKILMTVNIDSGTDLRSLMTIMPIFRILIQNFFKPVIEIPTHTYKRNKKIFKISLPLTGNNNLTSFILNLYPIRRVFPKPPTHVLAAYHHTGLVIDLRDFKFRPSFSTKIFDEKKRLIYDPSFVNKERYIRMGHIQFVSSLTSPRLPKRAGKRFLYIFPKSIKGKYSTDIILYNKDVTRLLSSYITRKNLKKCRVVVICKSF